MQLATESSISLNLKQFVYILGVLPSKIISLCVVRMEMFFYYTAVVQTTGKTVEKKLYFVVAGPLTVNHFCNIPVITKLVP